MENPGGAGSGREVAAETHIGDIPTDTLAVRLILARHHAGKLSQREAAEKCGVNYGSWSNWEDGRKPRDLLDVVRKVADGLQINYEWLLFGGPLTSARGVPVPKRPVEDTGRYRPVSAGASRPPVRPTTGRPKVRTDPGRPISPVAPGRRAVYVNPVRSSEVISAA